MQCDSTIDAKIREAQEVKETGFKVRFLSSSNKYLDLPRRYRCTIVVDAATSHLRIYSDKWYPWIYWETSSIQGVEMDVAERRIRFRTRNSYYEFAVCRGEDLLG